MAFISDTAPSPDILKNINPITPLANATVSDAIGTIEYTSVYVYYVSINGVAVNSQQYGRFTDPSAPSITPSSYISQTQQVTMSTTPATLLLQRIQYTPPTLNPGDYMNVTAGISDSSYSTANVYQGSYSYYQPFTIITAPLIKGAVSSQPVAASAQNAAVLSTLTVSPRYNGTDQISYTVKISVEDANTPTDNDGTLSVASGRTLNLSKTGVGTYTFTATGTQSLASDFAALAFSSTPVAPGGTRTTSFAVDLTDNTYGYTASNNASSIVSTGPAALMPLVAGVSTQSQGVTAGSTIFPLAGITVTDTNAQPLDSATITVIGGGTVSGAGLTRGSAAGTYTLAADTPANLTNEINNLSFTPPDLGSATSMTSTLKLAVTDAVGSSTVSTQVVETPVPTPPTPTPAPTPTATGFSPGGSTPPQPQITPTTVSAVYRFFDSNNGTHFFTSDAGERNIILASRPDLKEETNGFGDVNQGAPNSVAVYRFFDTVHGTHFFTSSETEKANILATRHDLTFESNATFYEESSPASSTDVAVYRMFDSKLGTHFYTGDAKEYAGLTTPGSSSYRADLVSEGVSFYAPAGSYT